jgi:DNA-binding response OmpR family regulator
MGQTAATILIVEDEPEVLDINARMLKRRGYDILTASSVEESYRCLASVTPDMLILDVMLPDGSGYDICQQFRLKSDNPVIFLTGKTKSSDKVEGLGYGGDYYLTKPYSFDELLAVAERLLSRYFKTKEKHERLEWITKRSVTLDIQKTRPL